MTFSDVPVEDVAAYWDERPCNIRHSDAPVGSRRFFDEVEYRKYAVEPHIPGFAQFIKWEDKNVLEIGCGLGTDTINFARAGATVLATDLSARSIEIAQQRAEVAGVADRIAFVCGDAERLEVELVGNDKAWHREQFDLVYSFGVIHHSPHPELILQQARKHLAFFGELRIMVYHRRSTKVLALVLRHPLTALRHGVDRAVAIQSEAQTGCPITYTYTRKQAEALVRSAGFYVTDMRVEHIFPWAIGPYRRRDRVDLRRRWYWKLVPGRMFRALEKRYGWHLLITAVIDDPF